MKAFLLIRALAILVLLMYSVADVSAQREGNNWYFGARAGITFNDTPPQPLLDGVLNTDEGCSAISDGNGQLLFYSDGRTIWNRAHQQMPNGQGLAGHPSSVQSGIIIPQPLHPGRYYVFSVGASEQQPISIHYSVVDMTRDGGMGDIEIKNTLLLEQATEKITAIHHTNGKDFWIIAHGQGNNNFYSYLLNESGISSAVVSTAGAVHPNGGFFASGALKASPDGNWLAAAIRDAFSVELFAFDSQTGQVVSEPIVFSNPLRTYGVEFSPDNTKLYISSGNYPNSGRLEQYNLNAGSANQILASRVVLGEVSNVWWGALQIAPDGRIYMAKMDSQYLGVIERPNELGAQCGFINNGFFLEGRQSRLGLTNFMQNLFADIPFVNISWAPTCFGDTMILTAEVQGTIDSLVWNFGDPASGLHNTDTGNRVSHLYSEAGRFTISVVYVKDMLRDTVITDVIVFEPPVPSLGKDTILCAGMNLVLSAGDNFETYSWSNGATTSSITVPATDMEYNVTVMDENGCIGRDTIRVGRAPASVADAGADVIICQGDTVRLRASGGVSYLWSPSTGLSCTDCAEPSAYPQQTITYTVTATNEYGCSSSDQVAITVNECNVTCNSISGVINTYTVVRAINYTANRITVDNSVGFDVGDTVLLIQMQGAHIDTSNTIDYGQIISYNGAGSYEYAIIRSVQNADITVMAALHNHQYDVSRALQLIRVPHYDHITVTDTLTCLPWNGQTGGVLAFTAECLILDGLIDVSGRGFRGGVYENFPGCARNPHNNEFMSDKGCYWARKGEGLAGNGDNGFIYGKGAPANAGGGGNNHNAGGGGGGSRTAGGNGGYGYLGVTGTIKTAAGQGGRQMENFDGKLLMGGGGGAGHANHEHGSGGAPGGGIVVIEASMVRNAGRGRISASGAHAANDTSFINPDGCGGGGAGGTVMLTARAIAEDVSVNVRGGNGGAFTNTPTSSGPGGGGSGGWILLRSDSLSVGRVHVDMRGGIHGTSSAGGAFGAKDGSEGSFDTQYQPAAEGVYCRGCMPVVLDVEKLCGETIVTLIDEAYGISSIELNSAQSDNIATIEVIETLPGKRVRVRVVLSNILQPGAFTLLAINSAGQLAYVWGEVYALPAKPVISWDGFILTATPAAAYQWFYQQVGIYNGIHREYIPTLPGTYRVQITDRLGCQVLSDEITIAFTSIAEEYEEGLSIYPNPGDGLFTLQINAKKTEKAHIFVVNALGKRVYDAEVDLVPGLQYNTLRLDDVPSGIYTVVVSIGGARVMTHLVKL